MLGDSIRRRRGRRHTARSAPERPPRRRLRWGRWILITIILLPLAFGVGYGAATLVIFPPAQRSMEEMVVTPRLVGRHLIEAEREVHELGLTIIDTTELPHALESAGTVIAQSPVPGQQLLPGSGMTIAISTGRAQLPVPDLIGLPYEDAASLAEQLGFTVNRREVVRSGPTGIVAQVEPAPGTTRQLPATIILIVTAEPEPEPEPGPESEPEPDMGRSGPESERRVIESVPALEPVPTTEEH